VSEARQEPDVRGGTDGIAADCAELAALAGRFGDAADESFGSASGLG
jgi:hypothetical protein